MYVIYVWGNVFFFLLFFFAGACAAVASAASSVLAFTFEKKTDISGDGVARCWGGPGCCCCCRWFLALLLPLLLLWRLTTRLPLLLPRWLLSLESPQCLCYCGCCRLKRKERKRDYIICVSLLLLLLLVLLLSFLRQPSSQVPFSLNDGSVLIAVMSYNGGRFACATEIEIKMERVGRRMVILLNRLRQARVLQGYTRKTQSVLFCQIKKEKRKTVWFARCVGSIEEWNMSVFFLCL